MWSKDERRMRPGTVDDAFKPLDTAKLNYQCLVFFGVSSKRRPETGMGLRKVVARW